MVDKTEFYYDCPECNKEQIVNFIPPRIEDGYPYRFSTTCSNCNTNLRVKINFSSQIKKINTE
ncbi:MAG: hypothetical protein ACOCP8_00500 [archaeon]